MSADDAKTVVTGQSPSSMNLLTTNIQKLNGENFLPWKRQITIVLKLRGLIDAILLDDVDEKTDMMATLILLEAMDDRHKIQVQAEDTAKKIVDSLERQYASTSENNLHRLLSGYFSFKKSPTDTLNQHVGKLKELRARLANLGENQTENMFQVALLNSLGNEFGDIASTWNATPPALKSTELLLNILQEKEEKLKEQTPKTDESLFLMRRDQRRLTPKEIDEKKKVTHCGNCGLKGHWWKECKQPKRQEQRDGPKDRPNFVASVGDLDPSLKTQWLADTGASSHMCNQQDWFEELELFEKAEEVTVGDGYAVKVLGKGKIRVSTNVDGQEGYGLFSEVLYIPDLATNLISIGACAEKGIQTVFSKGKCALMKENVILVEGSNTVGRLYRLDMEAVKPSHKAALLIKDSRSEQEWHEVLGHIGKERMYTLLRDDELGLKVKKEDSSNLCPNCPTGSGKRATHPSVDKPVNTPGTVHVDLSGKTNKCSLEGYFYYLVCKDEATEYCHIYFLKDKSEAPKMIAKLIAEYEVEAGYKIQYVQTDNGSEFLNDRMRALFLKEKIIHVTSAPWTPQQNGRIEREIGSITNMARTLLLTSELPLELWAEAISTACYLKNRLPTKRSDVTPFERFFSRKPFLKHLATFGASVHVLVNWNYLHKFDSRTVPGFLVGYTRRSNTYRVFLPSERRVIETSDLYFRPHVSNRQTLQVTEPDNALNSFVPESTMSFYPNTDELNHEEHNANHEEFPCTLAFDPEKDRRLKVLDDFFEKLRGSDNLQSTPQKQLSESRTNASTQEQDYITVRDETVAKECSLPPSSSPQGCANCSIPRTSYTNEPSAGTSKEKTPNTSMAQESAQQVPGEGHVEGRGIERTQSMLLRAREAMRKPARFLGLTAETQRSVNSYALAAAKGVKLEPESDCPMDYEEAIRGPEKDQWKKAIREELLAHEENGTWEVSEKPGEGCTLSAKWIFTKKRDLSGRVERFKARLVAKGYKQREGIDYTETFAPVARTESLRTLLALCAKKGLQMVQFDVSSAFLYGKLEEIVFMETPEGLDLEEGTCVKLIKSLYGLKQAPRCWHSKFDSVMREISLEPTISDPCVYVSRDKTTYLGVYVDDGIIFSKEVDTCKKILDTLNKHFKTKHVNGGMFLGMEIIRTEQRIALSQSRYINDLVTKYKLTNCNATMSPMADAKQLFLQESPRIQGFYREVIGSLLYCAMHTRPDILFPVTLLARFCEEPREIHLNAVLRVIKYLYTTQHIGLLFKTTHEDDITIDAFSDADWAGDISDSRSTSGTIILISGSPVIFASKKQTITALSSAEAEYVAACEAAKALEWLSGFLEELGVKCLRPTLWIDNLTTIRQIKNNQLSTKSKHVRLKFHFIRQLYVDKIFEIQTVGSQQQRADFLTKVLPAPRLRELTEASGISDTRTNTMTKAPTKDHVSKPWRVAHVLLVMLLMHATCGFSQPRKLTRVPQLIWQPTSLRVDVGAIEVDLELVYLSLCHDIGKLNTNTTKLNITQRAYKKLEEECFHVHHEKIEPLLEELETCKPDPGSDYHHSRSKRFVWFIPILVAIVVVAVVAAVAVSTWYAVKANQKVSEMEEREARLRTDVNNMKNLTTGINDLNNESHRQLVEKLETHRQMFEELTQLSPDLSWNSAKLYYKQMNDERLLSEIIRGCRDGRVATKELAELTDLDKLKGYDEKDSLLVDLTSRMSGSDKVFKFNFLATKKSIDTKVYKIKPFDVYRNMTEDPYLVTYKGPRYALYNSTANCTTGLDEPDIDNGLVYKTCLVKDFRDARLDHWERVINVTEKVVPPQIISLGTHKMIYCAYHELYYDNSTIPCPPYPIGIPRNINFTIGNYSNVADPLYLKGTAIIEKVQSAGFKTIEVDQDYLDQMALINEVRKKNTKLKELSQDTVTEKLQSVWTLAASADWLTILSIISIIWTLHTCFQRNGEGDNERVTVVNASPSPSAPGVPPTVTLGEPSLHQLIESLECGCLDHHHSHHQQHSRDHKEASLD